MAAKDDYERFSGVADDLELEDEERDNFISSAMKRRGHKPVTSWADSDDDGGGGDSDFFSGKRKQKERETRGGNSRNSRDRDSNSRRKSDWQYGA